MSYANSATWEAEHSAAELQDAFIGAQRDAERIKKEFVDNLAAQDSPAYDAEWTTRYGSDDRLIFVFSVVLDLEEDFDLEDYPYEAAQSTTEDLRRRLVGTKVDDWGVYVVSVTGRPRSLSGD